MFDKEWTRTEKWVISGAAVLVLVLGLTGVVRFPALVSATRDSYTREHHGVGEERTIAVTSRERCWGVPFVYRSCRTEHHQLPPDGENGEPDSP